MAPTNRLQANLLARLPLLLLLVTTMSCVFWTPSSRRASADARVIPNVPLQHWDIKSCGAGSLSSVLQHYGDTTTMQEWDGSLRKTRGGVMSIDMVIAARQKGFDARLVTGDRQTLERELLDGRPVILMLQVVTSPGKSLDFFHYIVLDGIDTGQQLLRTQFGDGKARWVPYTRLATAWRGGGNAAIFIRPRDPASDALRVAVTMEEKGQYDEAAREYRRILDLHPDSSLAWTNLGNVEVRRGNSSAAEEAFRKAIAVDGSSADALNNLAWLLYQQKRLEEAESLARRAVDTPAADAWTRLDTLARIQLDRGACRDAVRTWERAIEEIPKTRTTERAGIAQEMGRARATCS